MASSSSRILELASTISENTTKIDQYLTAKGIPHPSFEINSPASLELPESLQASREAVLDANTELSELLLGPREIVADYQYNYFVSLQAIYHYKIAAAFPVDGEGTFAQIAQKCGLDESVIRRILRHAMANRVFKEDRKGVVVHTGMSKLLAEDPLFLDYVGIGSEDMWAAAVNTVPAMIKWPNSQEPTHTGFSFAKNTEDSMYQYLGKHPDKAKRFAAAMSVSITGDGYELEHIVKNGPWASIGAGGVVVDVGGSHGDAMIPIAKAFPTLRFVIQDLPSTIEGHPTLPPELANRTTFMAHDFFTRQPIENADVFFFRWIFHNWPDKYCLQILQNLIPALKSGARIVVNEWCLPEPHTISNRLDRRMRGMDVSMLTIQNSQERDQDDWISLFSRADERFKFLGIKHPKGSHLSIIEFSWL